MRVCTRLRSCCPFPSSRLACESPPLPEMGKSSAPHTGRDIAAITYATNPAKKGLDIVLDAWRQVRKPGEELFVAGVEERELRTSRLSRFPPQACASWGCWRTRTTVHCCAARAYTCARRVARTTASPSSEALADGCMLVTTPSPGPYVALPLACALDAAWSRRISTAVDLGAALRTALDDPLPGYARACARRARPVPPRRDDRLVAEQLLPRLLHG